MNKVFDINFNRFNIYNGARPSDTVPQGAQVCKENT